MADDTAGSEDLKLPNGTVTVPPPAWVLEELVHHAARPTETTVEEDPNAPPVRLRGEALERWYGRVFQLNPATGGVDRSYSLWWLAVVLLEAGLMPSFVEQLLAERDVALGWTKFSSRRDASGRYRIIVERAHASRGPRRIHVEPPPPGRQQGQQQQTQQPSTLRWRTAAEVTATEDEDIVWLAYGILGESLITELDGKAKRSGKTTLLLCAAGAILRGERFLGEATTYTPVVYLTEQSGPSFKRNLRRAGLEERDDLHLLQWGDTTGWKWGQLIPEVLAKVEATGARVLIVDTLAQFSGVRGDEENKSGAALEVMEPLQAATTRKLAILLSRHDRKSGGDVGDSGRGSSAYAGAVDIILHLTRPEPKPGTARQRLVEGVSRFEETPTDLVIELSETEPQKYSVIGDVEQARRYRLRNELLNCLPGTEADALELEDLCEAVEAGRSRVWHVVQELLSERLVACVGRGIKGDKKRYYRVSENGA